MTAERAHHFGMVNRIVARDALKDEVARIAARIAERPRFGLALSKQAINLVQETRCKRTAMESVFHIHHLAHAHSQLTSGDRARGVDANPWQRRTRLETKSTGIADIE
jgi:enoyl-CoA hydratase